MSEADWRYHLTSKTIAQKIKTAGMKSTLTRISAPVAAPTVAFNQDRLSNEATKQKAKLGEYLANFLARGASLETLTGSKKPFTPLAFTPVGDNGLDTPKLTQMEKQALTTFAQALMGLGREDWRKAREWRAKPQVTQAADQLLRSNKNHYLARLAVQVVAFTYKIEETITASHIYFFLPQYAEVCFRDYSKHLNSRDLVMLRVHKTKIPGLIQDDSEFRAKMTKSTVLPDAIEVMSNVSQFENKITRTNDANWVAIKNRG